MSGKFYYVAGPASCGPFATAAAAASGARAAGYATFTVVVAGGPAGFYRSYRSYGPGPAGFAAPGPAARRGRGRGYGYGPGRGGWVR